MALEGSPPPSTSRRPRRSSSTGPLMRKRVRWADEEPPPRLLPPPPPPMMSCLVLAVLVINGAFLLLAVLSKCGLWWSPGPSFTATISTSSSSSSNATSRFFSSSSVLASSTVSLSLPTDTAGHVDHELRADTNHHDDDDDDDYRHPRARVRAWAAAANRQRRQTSPGPLTPASPTSSLASSPNATAFPPFDPIYAFQVDVPLLGADGRVVGAGTPDGFTGIKTTIEPETRNNNNTTATEAPLCEATLIVHTFGNSYGQPAVQPYTPPACLGDANSVVMNLTVQSQGRQFDRLFIVYLGDIEVFRSSTAQPRARGVSWTYMKDMSAYLALWRKPQTVIFDLGNLLNANLTGAWHTTLTARFFHAPNAGLDDPADTILAVSARQALNRSQPSVFTIPPDLANDDTRDDQPAATVLSDFPPRARRALLAVAATGQASEEFWWSNVLESATQTFNASAPNTTLAGFSPFREIQVRIDGQLAGVQWPFPVIFTGGVVPSLWFPLVGIDAFDLQPGEIDITPWLGVLCDGAPHTVSLHVVGLNDTAGTTRAVLNDGVNANWKATATIFVWSDPAPPPPPPPSSSAGTHAHTMVTRTTGPPPTVDGLVPTIAVHQALTTNSTGFNTTLAYTVSVSRRLRIASVLTSAAGTSFTASWTQTLTHADTGVVSNDGLNQVNTITTRGTDTARRNGALAFRHRYAYPLFANVVSAVLANGTTRVDAAVTRTKARVYTGPAAGTGATTASQLQLFAVLPGCAANHKNNQNKKTTTTTTTTTVWSTTQDGAATFWVPPNAGGIGLGSNGTQHQQLRFGAAAKWRDDSNDDDVVVDMVARPPATEELYFREVRVNSNGALVGADVERLAGRDVVGNRPPATGPSAPPPVAVEDEASTAAKVVVARSGAPWYADRVYGPTTPLRVMDGYAAGDGKRSCGPGFGRVGGRSLLLGG